MSESPDHGVVGDYPERIDILDEDIAGDVLEPHVVQKAGHLLTELGGVFLAVVLTPHQRGLALKHMKM